MFRVFAFLASIWRVLVAALRFRDDLLLVAQRQARSEAVILTVVLLAGISLLIGQSTILFINQLSPFWFASSLVLAALLFVLRLALWAAAAWILSASLFGTRHAFGPILRIIGLGSAPFVFGWLILLPYLGPSIARLLNVWSFLIVLHAVRYAWGGGFGEALVCIGGGWAITLAVARVLGLPLAALGNRFRRRLAGAPWLANPQDDLVRVAAGAFGVPSVRGDER
jgi:hypothetical protein